MRNIKPTNNKILVKRTVPEPKTASGIIIPQTAKRDDAVDGTVITLPREIEVLPGVLLKEGDTVIYKRYAGYDMELGDRDDYVLLDPRDLLGIYLEEEGDPELPGTWVDELQERKDR